MNKFWPVVSSKFQVASEFRADRSFSQVTAELSIFRNKIVKTFSDEVFLEKIIRANTQFSTFRSTEDEKCFNGQSCCLIANERTLLKSNFSEELTRAAK